jgi:hypothetical protein
VVVGAYLQGVDTFNGAAYIYDLSGPTPGVPVATLRNPGTQRYDQFGRTVAISGTRVVWAHRWMTFRCAYSMRARFMFSI